MQLFTISTIETQELKNQFINSIKDDWTINIQEHHAIGNHGNFGSGNFNKLLRYKIEYLESIIASRRNKIIIWSDIDIVFYRPCSTVINQLLTDNDIVFQAERWPGKIINSGFIAIKCNASTLALFKMVLQTNIEELPYKDQSAINNVLAVNKLNIKWDIFPKEFWAMSHYTLPSPHIYLHHANCTEPVVRNGQSIGSIQLKNEQFELVRNYLKAIQFINTLSS